MIVKTAAAIAVVSGVFCLTLLGQPPPAITRWTMLWPEAAPGALGTTDADRPAVGIFLPAKDKATGSAVVVCPGGGYQTLAPKDGILSSWAGRLADWLKVRGLLTSAAQTPGGDSRR